MYISVKFKVLLKMSEAATYTLRICYTTYTILYIFDVILHKNLHFKYVYWVHYLKSVLIWLKGKIKWYLMNEFVVARFPHIIQFKSNAAMKP